MSAIIIRQGLVVGESESAVADVLIVEDRIAEVAASIDAPSDAHEIDARGCWVGPGFVDLHTHLREPGRESAETIESGARAGALGGYCALVAMPNTEPALDSVALVAFVLERGARTPLDVAVAGAITKDRRGESLAPMAEMAALGVRLFTDDGLGVQDPSVMRRALTYAKPLGVRLAQHCEDERLAGEGSMNEGALSGHLGLTGRPALAEELMVLRDIELVRLTGAPLHFLHLSTGRSVAFACAARDEGLPITFEVAPHHLALDETACATYDPVFKVHPPLRGPDEVAALRDALRRGRHRRRGERPRTARARTEGPRLRRGTGRDAGARTRRGAHLRRARSGARPATVLPGAEPRTGARRAAAPRRPSPASQRPRRVDGRGRGRQRHRL